MTAPTLPDVCWPVDTGCCSTWSDLSPEIAARATSLATTALRALSGYRVGGCPTTVRPCRAGCEAAMIPFFSAVDYGYPFRPALNVVGQWVNLTCGCGQYGCSCVSVCEVRLPPPIGYVDSVQIDGLELPPEWYRVDDDRSLVWQGPDDLDCWPLCQDMTKPLGEVGTFGVTYLNALPVDSLAAYAAGVLACEFAKACSGGKCRLPSGVTSVVRQGVSYSMESVAGFPDGRTGLVEVDAWLHMVNPSALVAPSRVYSPDLPSLRVSG